MEATGTPPAGTLDMAVGELERELAGVGDDDLRRIRRSNTAELLGLTP